MSKFINKLNCNFTQVSNHIIQDNNISGTAFKLYCYIVSRVVNNPEWEFYNNDMQQYFKEGRRAFKGAKDELIEFGYIKKVCQSKRDDGTFGACSYEIFSSPNGSTVDRSTIDRSTANGSTVCGTTYKDIIKKQITNKQITNKDITKDTKAFFQKPSLDEVIEYSLLKGSDEKLATDYFNYYDSRDWKDSNGAAVKNWKLKFDKQWLKPKNALSVKSINSTFKKILEGDMRFYDEEKELIENLLLHFKALRKPPTTQNVIWILDALNELKNKLPIKEIVDKIIQNNWKSLNRDYFVGEIQKNQEQNKEKKIYDFNAIKEYTKGW
jgi:hypothetical protein